LYFVINLSFFIFYSPENRVSREFYLSAEEFIDAVVQKLKGKIQVAAVV